MTRHQHMLLLARIRRIERDVAELQMRPIAKIGKGKTIESVTVCAYPPSCSGNVDLSIREVKP